MALEIEPEIGVPIPDKTPTLDLTARFYASCKV